MTSAQHMNDLFPNTKTRQGGAGVSIEYHFQCSQCSRTCDLHAKTMLPENVIRKKMTQKGWMLGKQRRYDWCDHCLSIGKTNRLADKFRVITNGGERVPGVAEVVDLKSRARELAEQRIAKLMAKPSVSHGVDTLGEVKDDPEERISLLVDQVKATNERLALLEQLLAKVLPDMSASLDLILESMSKRE